MEDVAGELPLNRNGENEVKVRNVQDQDSASVELEQQLRELRERTVRAVEILEMHRRNGSFDDDYLQTYFLLEALDLQLVRLLRPARDAASS